MIKLSGIIYFHFILKINTNSSFKSIEDKYSRTYSYKYISCLVPNQFTTTFITCRSSCKFMKN